MADAEYGTMPQPEAARDASTLSRDSLKRSNSHWEVSDDEAYETLNGIAPVNVHNNFVKKVYALLTVELLYTAAISGVMTLVPSIRQGALQFVANHPTLFQVFLIVGLLGSVCWLMCVKKQYPKNMLALFVFLTFMSIDVGFICAVYYEIGLGNKIVIAALITAGIFGVLSAYAWLSNDDFSYMGGFLFAALFGLILLAFVQIFVHWRILTIVYCALGIIVFSGFILYDTYMIKKKLGPDEAIEASISLYLDIINLFLMILQLLGGGRR